MDLPDLDLGIKSPSENWCTSEPFSNAYERLLGPEYDVLAVITNYQSQKQNPPLRIQLIQHHYFEGHQIADMGLCKHARAIRPTLMSYGEAPAKKAFKFLTYAVQSEWLCARLLDLMSQIDKPDRLPSILDVMIKSIEKTSAKRRMPLPLQDKALLEELGKRKPIDRAIIDAADDWVTAHWREAARVPNENEWVRLQKAPLDGKLGVSFALQWRYNFGVFFNGLLKKQNLKEAGVGHQI
ncbi:MAG: hypothetical protein L0Y58_22300 [Verrucomicrobia subdivision 3 bacterium]|nr:hypothetical protein [Limisphaerales bacterium]